ncbi:MAG TPA: hypothetical protein VGB15_18255 [Longimicrobium sp.]
MNLQFESQPVGLLVHQVLCRGVAWRPVSPTRFVPPGAGASSPTFVEWRREGGRWVIAAFGEETFARDPLPEWVC